MNGHVRLAGFATRALALILDGGIVNAIAILAGFGVSLALGLFGVEVGEPASAALGAAGWLLWVGAYFGVFWTLAGQTPGVRFMGIRVLGPHGQPPSRRRALVRVGGLFLSALPLGAGFLTVLVDNRRRALHDHMAKTLVVHTREGPRSPRLDDHSSPVGEGGSADLVPAHANLE